MLKNRFSTGDDKDSPHQRHDYIIIKAHEAKMMEEYSNNRDMVLKHVEDLLPWLDLKGQWSLDIMQNGDDVLADRYGARRTVGTLYAVRPRRKTQTNKGGLAAETARIERR